MDKKSFLRQVNFFDGISGDNLTRLADICLNKKIRKKEFLFMEGEKGSSCYIMVEGLIRLFKTTQDGKESVIKLISPGEMFAETILFEKPHYPVSAQALEDSLLFIIPKHQFICLLTREEFRDEFIGLLMSKMRYLAGRLSYLTNFDVEERLLHFLREQFGERREIKTKLSKKDVAAAISTTPESLSRALFHLKKENRLSWEGGHIIIEE